MIVRVERKERFISHLVNSKEEKRGERGIREKREELELELEEEEIQSRGKGENPHYYGIV